MARSVPGGYCSAFTERHRGGAARSGTSTCYARRVPSGTDKELAALDLEYTRFNAAKTVGDARPSAFTVARAGPLRVAIDTARDGAYYNRVVGLTMDGLPFLDEALDLLRDRPRRRVDIDAAADERVGAALRERGFEATERLVWLIGAARLGESAQTVVQLPFDERDRIRPLLELDGAIDDALWAARRDFLCTEDFQFHVIEAAWEEGPEASEAVGRADGRQIISMATSFNCAHGTVLGNAFTRPAFRGRGCQAALLTARLADAHGRGAKHVLVDVAPDTTSHRNCVVSGFRTRCEQVWWEAGAATGA